jgi:transposase
LDYHDETIRVCVLAEDGKVLFNRDVDNDVQAVVREVWRFGRPRGVLLEACSGAADFATELIEQTGWKVRLAHPGYVRRMKHGPDKTDHGDAWLLADLERVNYVPEVWLADKTTRQLRRLVRYREGLKAERKNVKLRMRALLREERIPGPTHGKAWSKPWRAWLQAVELGEHSRWVMDQLLDDLTRIEAKVREVEKRMAEATAADADTQKLLAQPGIGLVTAVALRAEIGRFDRFKTSKQLSRFGGVTPCNASSGKRQADAGLVQAGSRELRSLLIETAKRLPRCDPHWKAMKERLCQTKPANVATCAIANRWLRRLDHIMVHPREEPIWNRAAA